MCNSNKWQLTNEWKTAAEERDCCANVNAHKHAEIFISSKKTCVCKLLS